MIQRAQHLWERGPAAAWVAPEGMEKCLRAWGQPQLTWPLFHVQRWDPPVQNWEQEAAPAGDAPQRQGQRTSFSTSFSGESRRELRGLGGPWEVLGLGANTHGGKGAGEESISISG